MIYDTDNDVCGGNWELHDFIGDKADMKWSPADWREAENAVQSGDKEKLEEAAPGVQNISETGCGGKR